LPFSGNCFDAALMTQVIPFLTDPAKAVFEMARVVRPGGWVATYTWDVPGYGLPGDLLARAGRSLGMTQLPHFWQGCAKRALKHNRF
jgi:ubiquinone/menaquinone biosynthesis C-methylase UbiE